MKIFKMNSEAEIPSFATDGSACFDIKACLQKNQKLRAYNPHNREITTPTREVNGKIYALLQPQFRTLIPTGLIFDIPTNHVLQVFIRSSMALKNGIMLANSTAIIDSDYTNELFVMIYNMGDSPFGIYHGDRIAQAMLSKTLKYTLEQTEEAPGQKTNRDGGLGSTGV